jgi:alpha-galactosidase
MSEISFEESSSTWLLRMAKSSYGIGLAGESRVPRHLHWGRPLDHRALSEIATELERSRLGEEAPLEYVAWGGLRYDEPSLKVEYSDGTRATEWQLVDSEVRREGTSTTLVLELADLAYPLRAGLCYRVFDDSDVLERWVRLVNVGGAGTIVLRQAHSANWWMPERDRWRLTYLHGAWGRETQPVEHPLAPGKTVLESRRGVTSHQVQPFFALDPEGTTSEVHGEVFSGQLAWSGSWKLVVETTSGGRVHVSGGLNDFDAPYELAPGTELVLPVFAGCYTREGLGAMSRTWHDYELSHVLSHRSRPGGSPSFPAPAGPGHLGPTGDLPALRPVLYNSWEATEFAVNEQKEAALAELAAEMGVELFVLDDGWFIGRGDERAGLGDWTVDLEKFPRGLGPLVERVTKLGMGFGLWVEPEMVNPESNLYRAHPDWTYHFANRSRTESRNQLVLNLGRDDVAGWVFGTVDRLLSEQNISFIKWDMNRPFSEPGWPERVGSNPERAWVDHVRNLYDILDRLRAAHPKVAFEACSSGGGRADLGILSRSEQVWTSDNTDAWDRIAIQEGFSYAHAPMAMSAWVTDSPNVHTGRRLPLRYRFHVAMAGSLGIGGNLTEWSSAELAEAKALIATYKEVRPTVQHGRCYRLASTRTGTLGAVEYLSRDGIDVVVLAWTGVRRFRPTLPAPRVRLAGLEPSALYRDLDTGRCHLGAVLEEIGVHFPDAADFSSMLVRLARLS